MLDLTRKITTRDGRAVRILCTDFKGGTPPYYTIIAAITEQNPLRERICYFWATGRHLENRETGLDLINPPIEVERYMQMDLGGKLGTNVYYYRDLVPVGGGLGAVKVRITVMD